ncbi:MAG: hypothetical protein GX879_03755, partial [Bacteroidales bacterium]|nr:hypothetical protein [Bacteroidales bacterium]
TKSNTFNDSDTLIKDVDAIIALSPMSSPDHIENFVRNAKHVLFEPSHFFSKEETERLVNIIDEVDVKVQPSLDKRYNMAYVAVRPFVKAPRLIVSNHFVEYSSKENISVLHDILLNDIDLVLSLVNSEIKSVHAVSASINKTSNDIVNVRIEFNNKSVAQFNAGRIAIEPKNEIYFYQNNNFVYADLLNRNAYVARKINGNSDFGLFSTQKNDLFCDPVPIGQTSANLSSVKAFADSIVKNKSPEVNLETMMRTFSVLQIIAEKLKILSH